MCQNFLSKAEYFSIVFIYRVLFIHSFVDGHWVAFTFLVTVNNVAVNMGVQISLGVLAVNSSGYPHFFFF